MKNLQKLIKVAARFQAKYGQESVEQTIQRTLAAAAGREGLGIMNFPQMLKADKASLRLYITKNGKNIFVSDPSLTTSNLASKYAALPEQIKKYLEKYIEVFPHDTPNQTFAVEYSG